MADRPRAVIIVGALAVAIAAIAAYALYNYLKGQEQKVSEAVATQRVIVAAAEIPGGKTIEASQLKLADWPKASVPSGSFNANEQVVGRVAIQTIQTGDNVTEAKLVPKEGPISVLTYKIPEGHRAMTVSVDQVAGVAGFLTPGNMVDVVLTTTPLGSTQPISKIVLQNMPILAIGQTVENREGKAVIVPTVTMDVTPEDAEKLAIASTQGRLQLVLRKSGDTEIAKTGGATVTKVFGGAAFRETPAQGTKVRVIREEAKKPVESPVEIWR